jgi:hypothetical protein
LINNLSEPKRSDDYYEKIDNITSIDLSGNSKGKDKI